MKKPLKGILFDVDGTLLDTAEYIFQAFEHAFRRHGVPVVSRQELASLMGTPLELVYEKVSPTADAVVLSATHREFQRHNADLIKVFPGVIDMLVELRGLGLRLAAVTSRREHVSESMESLGLTKHLDLLLTAADVQYHKPHPEGVLKALEKLSLQPEEAMMVGDAVTDIQAGKAGHVLTMGVTWGFVGPAIQRAHPDYVATRVQEIVDVIQGLV